MRTLALVLGLGLGAPAAVGQCLTWDTYFGTAGGEVWAMQSFDDGSGPALFVGGGWPGVVKWLGTGWVSVGILDGAVGALGVYSDGAGPALYAGGVFTGRIARWNGSTWTVLANGINPQGTITNPLVYSLCAFDDGTGPALYVGGVFNGAWNGPPNSWVDSKGILKWNGTVWSTVGGGVNGAVTAFAVYDDGSGPALYVGGPFWSGGGAPASYLAKWNGTAWSTVGGGVNGGVTSFAVYDDGTGQALYVGGGMTIAGGVPVKYLAKWNGSVWSAVPGDLSNSVIALTVFDDGNGPALYVGGPFGFVSGLAVRRIARWDGTNWSTLGNGVNRNSVDVLAVHDDGTGGGPDLYLGAHDPGFTQAGGGIPSLQKAKWKGCAGPIDPMCFGDQTVAPCPCSNYGISGHGCENSAGTGGARLFSQGTVNPDTIVLTSAGELPSSLSIFLQGSVLNPTTVAFGDGIRCVGGVLKRLYLKSAVNGTAQAPQSGDPSITQQSAILGDPILPGMIRYYQVYYRDPDTSHCPAPTGSTFDSSNGLRIVW